MSPPRHKRKTLTKQRKTNGHFKQTKKKIIRLIKLIVESPLIQNVTKQNNKEYRERLTKPML